MDRYGRRRCARRCHARQPCRRARRCRHGAVSAVVLTAPDLLVLLLLLQHHAMSHLDVCVMQLLRHSSLLTTQL